MPNEIIAMIREREARGADAMKRTTLTFVLAALVGGGSSLQAESAPEYRGDYEGTG